MYNVLWLLQWHWHLLGPFDVYALHDGHYRVLFHFPDVTTDYPQVGDQRRVLERLAFHPVHGHVGQRRGYHGIDRERVPLDRAERAIGDRQMIYGRDERVRRQFVRFQIFQRHLRL